MAFVPPPAVVGQGEIATMAVQEEAAERVPDGQEVAPLACERCKRHVATVSPLNYRKSTANCMASDGRSNGKSLQRMSSRMVLSATQRPHETFVPALSQDFRRLLVPYIITEARAETWYVKTGTMF